MANLIRRISLIPFLFVVLVPFAQAQVHLQHSRIANDSFFCFEFCFPGDDLTIQVKVTADQTTAPGVYQIQLASGEGNLFTVNPDHTLSTFDDPSNPFIKTFFYGPFGDGDRSVTITGSNSPIQLPSISFIQISVRGVAGPVRRPAGFRQATAQRVSA